jgi:CP family cyanate transporter-like MFS transporter
VNAPASDADRDEARKASAAHLLNVLCLLWLAGSTTRITVAAVPPVIPLIHDDLRLSETQVGLLIGLPLFTWALAAIPGSLLIARLGARLTLIVGILVTAMFAAGRGAAPDVWLLFLATLLMGAGTAIIQPAILTLVREWLPHRIGLATAVSTNGMMLGAAAAPALTIPLVLPLVAGSWRLDVVVWAAPVLVTAALVILLAPRSARAQGVDGRTATRWWPDWKDPLIWLLGLTFGCNNALFYGTAAFLPDYLTSVGRADLIGLAIGWLSGSQLIASTLLLATADHLQRRAWPYLVFGLADLAGVVGMTAGSGLWIVFAAAVVGFSLSITFVVTLALPPVLSPPGDVHRMSAGMLTVSFSWAVIIPVICGALWDLTGQAWAAFVPLGLCAAALILLGLALSGIARRSS